MNLLLTPRTLPDADSANVIADWPGSERPDDYVVVSGHLDSWDLATGATDDGAGVIAAAGVIQVLQQLNLHARRSIRFIGWSNEENGGRGHQAYFDSVRQALAPQCAAIESDLGAGRSLGADIEPLQTAGVPGFAPLVDARHYFDHHHTAADTLDKVDPQNLKTQVATMAVLAYYLAELPEPLPRVGTP